MGDRMVTHRPPGLGGAEGAHHCPPQAPAGLFLAPVVALPVVLTTVLKALWA